jgi:hypothetical protein
MEQGAGNSQVAENSQEAGNSQGAGITQAAGSTQGYINTLLLLSMLYASVCCLCINFKCMLFVH